MSFKGKVRAKEFPQELEWLNTAQPLVLSELYGKIVLLDFWTCCCINCMHVLPDLKKLEEKYPDELVVIGVHAAKFTNEKETANIRQAILRYDITHPVVNDLDGLVRRQYGVRAWPSFVLIDPEGKIVGRQSGERIYELFDRYIEGLVREFAWRGQLDRVPLELQREQGAAARFNKPQGIALDGETLYVADTQNHAVRKIDLKARQVTTLIGTGRQAQRRSTGGTGRQVALNSPWDLLVHNGSLYVALAGLHQLWRLDLQSDQIGPHAGSQRENRLDGPLLQAALAQPSGIATDGEKLYFADSEVSSIRSADLDPAGRVTTLVGEGLFEFGDEDGKGWGVKLQHPLGVLYCDGLVYVADTYNHKIKKLDLQSRRCDTLVGTGQPGSADGLATQAQLNEPSGLALAQNKLYIADTNNHRVRVFDFASGLVSTL
jgi:thiol-disulfide isomerase/thioredoxin